MEIYECIQTLSDEHKMRLIIIEGEKGYQQNAVSNYSLKYCIDRGFFEDGVFEIDLEHSTPSNFLKDITTTLRLTYTEITNI